VNEATLPAFPPVLPSSLTTRPRLAGIAVEGEPPEVPHMKRSVITAGLFVVSFAASAFAADQTWTGMVGDSKCGVNHKSAQEHNANLTDTACTEACIKGGAEYILSSGGKVYKLENQKDPALAENAGKTVMVTGTLKGNTITASRIVAK
jgi:hypothetical protein